MKSILLVIENFRIGGIQKSLINLINSISGLYDIDIAAFDPNGGYKECIPPDIHMVNLPKHYCSFAKPRDELKGSILWLYKSAFFFLAKLIDKGKAFEIVSPFYKMHKRYDVAISFSHSGDYKSVNGICPEFVLKKTNADRKICFIHCDYQHSGFMSEYNNKMYTAFDKIACCSESVKEVFLKSNSEIAYKTFTVRNFYDLKLIQTKKDDLKLSSDKIHLFSVARLSKEKGIIRAIDALHRSGREDIECYFIGDGPLRNDIERLVQKYHLEEQVHILGAMNNPYPILLNADYLFVPSFNEAAPMVFDEAKTLGIPIASTETTSAREMLDSHDIICENTDEGIYEMLRTIEKPYDRPKRQDITNDRQLEQFKVLVG